MSALPPLGRHGEAPILTVAEFGALRPALEGTIVATSGGFDPIHPGHAMAPEARRALHQRPGPPVGEGLFA